MVGGQYTINSSPPNKPSYTEMLRGGAKLCLFATQFFLPQMMAGQDDRMVEHKYHARRHATGVRLVNDARGSSLTVESNSI